VFALRVELTFAWLTAHRRLARDCERHPATSEAMIRWGRDQHHQPMHRPRLPGNPATTTRFPKAG
jgi:hypothetical protein